MSVVVLHIILIITAYLSVNLLIEGIMGSVLVFRRM